MMLRDLRALRACKPSTLCEVGVAVGAAAGLGGAMISAGASGKASKAATKAADADRAVQQQQYEQGRSDLAPYTPAGFSATSALMGRLGLPSATAAAPSATAGNPFAPANNSSPAAPYSNPLGLQTGNVTAMTGGSGGNVFAPPAGAPAKTGMAGVMPAVPDIGAGGPDQSPARPLAAGQPDWAQVLKDRPDVMAEYQRASSTADHNSPVFMQKGLDSPEHYAQYWYNNLRNPSDYTAQQPGQAAAPASATPAAPIPGQTLTSSDNGGLGDRAALARPTFGDAQPSIGQGPMSTDYLQNFQTSPGYQFRMDQGIRNLNASYGARGLLKSDAAIKGINDYGQGQASQEYGNWFGQQMQRLGADQGQYNNDRTTGLAQYNQNRNVFNNNFDNDTSRYDANFNSDRGYATDQYNQYTGNLFDLARLGQASAAGTAAAGQNYANQATATNNSLASVKANAALAGANGINGALTTGLQAYGKYSANPFGAAAGGTYSGNAGTGGSANPFGISFS